MRPGTRALLAAALALLLPAAARGQSIVGSAHDLSSGSGAVNRVHSTTETEICKFCHTPHNNGSTQKILWNHAASGYSGVYSWGASTTTSGTTLPTANSAIRPESKLCLGCHDGSVSIGQVANAAGGTAGTIGGIAAVANVVDATGRLISGPCPGPTCNVNVQGASGSLAGSHPVSIPYAGETAYNGIDSKVAATGQPGSYWTVVRSGCQNITGICTSATGVGTQGARIQLYPNAGGKTNVGIECDTCHEPHNRYGFRWFMRADAATSDGLCRSCHNK